MKTKLVMLLSVVLSLSGFFAFAAEKTDAKPAVIADLYPGLTMGTLSCASPKDLPEKIVLQAEGVQFTQEDIDKIIASQPEAAREELKKNAFTILEQESTKRILLSLAKKATSQSKVEIPKDDNELITQFFETTVFKKIEVTDAEMKTFYDNNKEMCGGATFDQVGASLKEYLVSQKKQKMAADYIRDLGKQIPIQVSAGWVKQQAVLAFDNPVDKARKSGKPSLVDFGATGCKPCDMLAPILETLTKKYEGKANVIFIHVQKQQMLASRYGIQSIPTQIFFDKDGKEISRHAGFFPQAEIEKILKEMGVQ
jgi:thioredoxin